MEKYKQLIANGETEAALNLLMEQRDQHSANTSKAIVVLKAAWTNLKKQRIQGTIAPEEAERVSNRINMGILNVVQDMDIQGEGHTINLYGINSDLLNEQTSAIVQQIENAHHHTVRDNNIQVGQAENVVVGSGNTITTKIRKGWGIFQYSVLVVILAILGFGGWYAFTNLAAGNENVLFSLSEVRASIALLAKKDNAVRIAFDPSMRKQLEAGWEDLKNGNVQEAIYKLEEVVKVAPAPKLLLELGLAYRKNDEEGYAKKYILEAFEKSPGLKREYIESLRGKKMDLLDFTVGTEVVTATAIDWENVLNNINYFQDQVPSEAVFGFGNGLSATFDQFEVKIEKVHYNNPKNIELYAGDSPNGAFKKIATIQVQNLYVKGLYQKFPFPPTTSKYFKIKVLKAQGGSFTFIPDMKLMGTLQ
jgi:tetratricopeptide (TPR) repeat protein